MKIKKTSIYTQTEELSLKFLVKIELLPFPIVLSTLIDSRKTPPCLHFFKFLLHNAKAYLLYFYCCFFFIQKSKNQCRIQGWQTNGLESYITNIFYRVMARGVPQELKHYKAGVPQAVVLGHVLYLLFTQDSPKMINIKTATFANDITVLAIGANVDEVTEKLQQVTNEFSR